MGPVHYGFKQSPVVAVQMPWDIARCMLMVVHHNAGICMSGVVSCTICGCVGGCTAPGVCEDIAGSGCTNAMGYCKVHVDGSSLKCRHLYVWSGGCVGSEGDCVGDVCGCVGAGGVCWWQ